MIVDKSPLHSQPGSERKRLISSDAALRIDPIESPIETNRDFVGHGRRILSGGRNEGSGHGLPFPILRSTKLGADFRFSASGRQI